MPLLPAGTAIGKDRETLPGKRLFCKDLNTDEFKFAGLLEAGEPESDAAEACVADDEEELFFEKPFSPFG